MNTPPLLVSFSETDYFCRAYVSRTPDDETVIRGLVGRRLPPITSMRSLSVLFGYSLRFILSMANKPRRHYRSFVLRTGAKVRRIDAPRVALKIVQQWFGYHLARAISLPVCVHGFVPGCSTITAAKSHLGAKWVMSVDIRDFFPSITLNRVRESLERIGYPAFAAASIAKLVTLDGVLPQGSPASPALSNLVFRHLDTEFLELAISCGAVVTRYADDIVFSGKQEFPPLLLDKVSEVLKRDGWSIAEEKTSIRHLPDALNVHGILVHGDRLRLSKKYRNQIRMMKHLLAHKAIDPEVRRKFAGHVAYAQSVDRMNADRS